MEINRNKQVKKKEFTELNHSIFYTSLWTNEQCGGHTQQNDDCLVVLVRRQCRRFRQAFERVAHVGAQPPVLAERFKFQVVVHFPAVVQQPCYLFVQFLAGRFQLRFGSGKQ